MLVQLAECSIRALLVALSAAAVLWVFRRKCTAALAHAVWTAVLGGMLVLLPLTAILPPIPIRVAARVEAPQPAAILLANPTQSDAAVLSQPRAIGSTSDVRQRAAIMPVVWNLPGWPDMLLFAYCITALFFLCRLAAGALLMRKLLRASSMVTVHGPHAHLPLYESAAIEVPSTAGWITPKVLLPSGWQAWPEAKRQAVLAHEMAHIRRRDSLVAFAAGLNRCLFWFHPLAWWLERKLALLAEQACDECSFSEAGDRERYASLLLDMAGAVKLARGRVSWHAVAMARPSHIRQRIEHILDEHCRVSKGLTKTGWAAVLLSSIPVFYGFGAARIVEQQPAPVAARAQAPEKKQGAAQSAIKQTATKSVEVFRDDFDGRLQPGWQWMDPKGDCTKSLDVRKGYLRIVVGAGRHDLWTAVDNYYAPRLVREATGDFVLETKIAGPGRQIGGLLVWKDYRNFVRFERGAHFKNEIYFAFAADGKFDDIALDYVGGEAIWLRLERKGSVYAASYSVDGKQWHPVSRTYNGLKRAVDEAHENWMDDLAENDFTFKPAPGSTVMRGKDPLLVGLSALTKLHEMTIDFDYFEMRGR